MASARTLGEQMGLYDEAIREMGDTPIGDLPGLSTRAVNSLTLAGISTVGQLARYHEDELLHIRSFGTSSVEMVKAALASFVRKGPSRPLGEQIGLLKTNASEFEDVAIQYLPGLSARSLNALALAGIATVGQLARCNDGDLLRIPTFGVTCLDNVKSALRRFAAGERSPAPLARPAPTERGLPSEKGRLLAAWLQSQPSLPREMSLQEIGSAIGLSRERVRQLLNKLGVSERKRRPLHIMLTKRRGSANLEVMTPLGEFVRSLRKAQGLTLDKLAQRSGITLRSIQAIETGDSLLPRPETLQALARGFGIDVSVLAVKVYEAPPLPSKEETAPVR